MDEEMLFLSVDSYTKILDCVRSSRDKHWGILVYTIHTCCIVQQIMSFSTNKAFPTVLLIAAGHVRCCVKSTVGSLNCINRTE